VKIGGHRIATATAMIAGLVLLASIDAALAQSGGGANFQPIDTAFKSVLSFMTGSFATTAATIAVCAVGFMALTSRIPWAWCFSIIVGIAFIFGGAQLVQSLSSGLGGN
jgi:type IV secretion system protein VirB2